MRVIHAPTFALSETVEAAVSVEAEYGSLVAEGTQYTAAHHQKEGPYAGRHLVGPEGRPAPCNDPNIPVIGADDLVVISHVDLDTIGGVLRAGGAHARLFGPEFQSFWDTAEWVDLNGVHRFDPDHDEAPRMFAVWAWLANHREKWPKDRVADVTDFMTHAGDAMHTILTGQSGRHTQAELLDAGQVHIAAQDALSLSSWVETRCTANAHAVVLRQAETFVNHLYRDPNGVACTAVIGFNSAEGSLSVSLYESIEGISCCDLVQDLWGPLAGGHQGIAGSPRGQRMTSKDLEDLARHLLEKLAQS